MHWLDSRHMRACTRSGLPAFAALFIAGGFKFPLPILQHSLYRLAGRARNSGEKFF